MKIKKIFAIFLSAISLTSLVDAQEQKVLFCAHSISYDNKFGAEQCKNICDKYSESTCLQSELEKGWVIGSTSPKEVNEYEPKWGKCACVGTQYVLSKQPPKQTEKLLDQNISKQINLLEKEIELLKKENTILKKENDQLLQQIDALKINAAVKKKP